MSVCPSITTGSGFLTSVLDHIDCQAQTIGASGYQALASTGSPVSIALTGLLTLFIAIWGIRLLMGHVPDGGVLIAIALKVGIVLMLSSSWAAYRVIAYDLVLHAPAEIAASMAGAADLPGSDGALIARLQGVDDGMLAFTALGTGRFDLTVNPAAPQPDALPLARTVVSDDLAFGMARLSFLVATIGLLSLLWLSAGLLLALAPLFAGALLFEGTRGFFFGWTRALVAAALGTLTLYVMLAIQIELLEPWLANALSMRQAKIATPAAPVELLVINLAFALMAIGSTALCGKIAFALHIPTFVQERWRPWLSSSSSAPDTPPQRADDDTKVSRAMLVSQVMMSTQRREAMMISGRSSLPTWNNASTAAGASSSSSRMSDSTTARGQGFHPIRRTISSSTLERRKHL